MISTNDRIPLSYWHNRLQNLPRPTLMPIQRARIARLEATLRSLTEADEASFAEAPLRPTGTRM
jgi:hypothetical protein